MQAARNITEIKNFIARDKRQSFNALIFSWYKVLVFHRSLSTYFLFNFCSDYRSKTFIQLSDFKAAFILIYTLIVYILIYILRNNTFFYCAMTIYVSFIPFQIKFDLKSINQEPLLFLKLQKKHSIQYFTIELWIMNWSPCYLWI